jgi:hypothetical protein
MLSACTRCAGGDASLMRGERCAGWRWSPWPGAAEAVLCGIGVVSGLPRPWPLATCTPIPAGHSQPRPRPCTQVWLRQSLPVSWSTRGRCARARPPLGQHPLGCQGAWPACHRGAAPALRLSRAADHHVPLLARQDLGLACNPSTAAHAVPDTCPPPAAQPRAPASRAVLQLRARVGSLGQRRPRSVLRTLPPLPYTPPTAPISPTPRPPRPQPSTTRNSPSSRQLPRLPCSPNTSRSTRPSTRRSLRRRRPRTTRPRRGAMKPTPAVPLPLRPNPTAAPAATSTPPRQRPCRGPATPATPPPAPWPPAPRRRWPPRRSCFCRPRRLRRATHRWAG